MLVYVCGVNYNTVTIRSIWHNSAADFSAFLKISAANLRILWSHIPTELRNVSCVVKRTQPNPLTAGEHRPNPCIIGDAILPQTDQKIDQKRCPEFGGLLWRHLTPHRKTAL